MTRYGRVFGAFGLTALLVTAAATRATAQPLGTFRWQTQPFCNVLVLAVTGTPAGFRMEGIDDNCGGTPASAIGMAYFKADATVGVGLTLVFASAVSLHIDATINPGAGFSGSWGDSVGRAGTLAFTPGAGTGGPLRPVVVPVDTVTYGTQVAQPPGGGDRGLSVHVSTDTTGGVGDAAAIFGQFGGATGFTAPGSAGIRGDSADVVGVMGTTNSGWGVVGGAGSDGIAVQGYAEGTNSVGVHAVHAQGGTALEINHGSIKVSGGVRAAFTYTVPFDGTQANCRAVSHPLLNGDPNALVFVTSQNPLKPAEGMTFFGGQTGWVVCSTLGTLFVGGDKINVLVIKQ